MEFVSQPWQHISPSAGISRGVLILESGLDSLFPTSSVRRRDGAATPERSRAETCYFIYTTFVVRFPPASLCDRRIVTTWYHETRFPLPP
jgi:hypothetical protein